VKILVVTHYYPPEIGAPQARLSEMAKAWVKTGNNVTVITCFPNHPTGCIPPEYYPIYKKKRRMSEVLDGVQVERCWVYATPNKGFLKKILGHISFMFSSVIQNGKKANECDVIIVSSPTLFSAVSAWWLGWRYRKPYVIEVRDLWPAIFVELGVLKNKPVIRILEWLELFLYKKAALVIPVTRRFSDNIISRGIDSTKVHVITNGVDLSAYNPREKSISLLDELKLTDKFIVLYMGAHGISHALTKIVDVAERLSSEPRIHFLLVGEGAEKERVLEYARKHAKGNLTCLPGQPRKRVSEFYSIMDVGLVPLRNIPLFDTFIPSKMFEIMAMAKPIVASVRGETAEILEASKAAIVVEPENVSEIAKAVLTFFNDREKAEKYGCNGRVFVEQNFDRTALAKRYSDLISRIALSPE
jgi:glycosyltransferase involved in cell wall biosynthesis